MKRLRAWELRRRAAAFFLPNRCPFCDRLIGVTEFWCAGCYDRLKFVDSPGDIPEGLDGFSAVCSYTGRARSAVLRMKDGWYRYPIDAFAVLIAENARELIETADVITAVPTGRARRNELGYAQSRMIAKLCAEICRKPYRDLLQVVGNKSEQKRLSAAERWENARRSYAVSDPEGAAGRKILLIDDVCTTGATLSCIAEKLRKAGAESVSAAVFARTPKPK